MPEEKTGYSANPDFESVDTEQINTTLRAGTWGELVTHVNNITSSATNSNQGGAKIVLGEGVITPDSADLPLDLSSKQGIVIEGQGDKATKIDASGLSNPIFESDRSGESSSQDKLILRDFVVDGDNTAGSALTSINNVHSWRFERVMARDLDDGIIATASWTGVLYDCDLENCATDGLRVNKGTDGKTNAVKILGGKYNNNGRHGINAENIDGGLWLLGTNVEGNNDIGAKLVNVSGYQIEAYFESNGSGMTRPLELGLSPDPANNIVCGAGVVSGSFFAPSDTAIKVGEVNGLEIAGNEFNGSGSETAIELDTAMDDVRVTETNNLNNMGGMFIGPNDGSNLDTAEDLNNGVWRTSVFDDYVELQGLANNRLQAQDGDSLKVVIHGDVTGSGDVIDCRKYPPGTTIEGVSRGKARVECTDTGQFQAAVRVEGSDHITVRDLTLLNSGNGQALWVRSGEEHTIENVVLEQAGDRGCYHQGGPRASYHNVVCLSSNISNGDIDIDAEDCRLVGCDASIDSSDVTNIHTAGNADSA